jgi:hypothetical protein
MDAETTVRVSSADLTPLQIAESQAGCLGRWICEDSLGFVEFDSQEEADAVLVAAMWSGSFAEVTVAQADATFRWAERRPLTDTDRASLERIKRRILERLP